MNIRDAYSAKAIANVHTEVASNKIAYLGEGLFPSQQKAGIDLKWIKTSSGLPVSLAPSAFDTVSTLRSREGFEIKETEMAYFKESMLVKEQDEIDIMRAEDSADPFAKEVLARVFNDAETLIGGAEVVAERMRMSLLANANGKPSISIAANGATYAYDYDPQGTYVANNFTELLTNKWDVPTSSDPLADISDAMDKVEANTGSRPAYALMSKKTMNYIKQSDAVKSAILAQNPTANIFMTDARVKELFANELGLTIIVYTKQYKDENKAVKKFYPDGMVTLLPEGTLGTTWRGITPEQRTLMQRPDADVSIVENGIAVSITVTDDPVHTKTTVSEIILPSFENMDLTYMLKVYDVAY